MSEVTPPHKAELEEIYQRCDVSNNRTDNPLSSEKFKAAINAYCYRQVMELIGGDLEESDGWDWAFGDEAKCCPGDDFAYFGNHIKKQLRQAAVERFGQK